MNEYFPTVVQVIPLDNFHVQVFFDDEFSCIDIDPFTVYELESINNLIAWIMWSQFNMSSMKALGS